MDMLILLMPLFCAAAPPVETSKTPETMLYVRTTPEGAEIIVDDRPLGTSPGLFKVPAGVRRIVVELDGHEPDGEEVTIKAGQIKRMTFRLKQRRGPDVAQPKDPVGQILEQLQIAHRELDAEKLEALFLPPDDTPAGKALAKELEEARKRWPELKASGARGEMRVLRVSQHQDGKDLIVRATAVLRLHLPSGDVREEEETLQFRITPTADGWRIAERMEGAAEHLVRPQATKPSKTVASVLTQFLAALSEKDFGKLEPLFLPPDDTPAGKARRKYLDEVRAEFSDPKHREVRTLVQEVHMKEGKDGGDTLVEVEMVTGIPRPDGEGWLRQGQRTLELRITPADDGWSIAGANLIREKRSEAYAGLAGGLGHAAPQQPTVAKAPRYHPVSEILSGLKAAFSEASAEKLEALLLPPDDTPAGKSRREYLEAARAEFSNPNRKKTEAVVRLVHIRTGPDEEDGLIEAEVLVYQAPPDGWIGGRERRLQLRIKPTAEGWRIAEVDIVTEVTVNPPPQADEARQRRPVPTAVTVTFRGEPVEGATVMFIPRASDGPPASGQTDTAGRAVLSTSEQGDGVMPGTYGVTISKVVTEKKGVTGELRHLLPRELAVPQTSGLVVEVAGSGNDFRFDLPSVEEPPSTTGMVEGSQP